MWTIENMYPQSAMTRDFVNFVFFFLALDPRRCFVYDYDISIMYIFISKVVATGRQTDSLAGMVNVKRFGAFTHFWSEFKPSLSYLSLFLLINNYNLIPFIPPFDPQYALFIPRRSRSLSLFLSYIINNSYFAIIKFYSNCNIGFLVRYNVFSTCCCFLLFIIWSYV